MRPIGIVNHIMQGYRATMDAWARSPHNDGRGAHFGVNRAGEAAQYASIYTVAWHASRRDARPPTWPLYRVGVDPGSVTVGVEHEGFSVDPGYGHDYLYDATHPWPADMVAATARVQRWVCDETGIAPGPTTIIGHRALNPISRADDPGSAWPQDQIIAGAGGTIMSPPLSWLQRRVLQSLNFPVRMGGLGGKITATPLPMEGGLPTYKIRVG